jgi:hypothetical protein
MLELSDDQVVQLVRQLPVERRREALYALAGERGEREARLDVAEARARALAEDRGVEWDALDDEQRLGFIDDLIHEDRP